MTRTIGRIGTRLGVDETILKIAARQHGVVTRGQLEQAGLSADAIDRRVKASLLHRIHRGVYVLEPLRAQYTSEMAAALACGDAAVVSYFSAAALSRLLSRQSQLVDVSVSRGCPGRMSGIRIHRVRSLRPDEVTTFESIPITTAARTIKDLARVASQRELEIAVTQAFDLGLTDRDALFAQTKCAHHPGVGRLRALLTAAAQPMLTRSEAEEKFFALVRRAQLPLPVANRRVAGYEVDFFWRTERFIVEIDGFAYHSSATRFESDRRRDARLAASGVHVMRVTWRQLVSEPEAVLVRLAQALTQRAMKQSVQIAERSH